MARICKSSLGIGIAAVALLTGLTACQDRMIVENSGPMGSNVVRLGDSPVATVDGTKIFLSDVEREAVAQKKIEPGTPLTPADPVFQTVLDELIDRRLMALSALRQSLDQGDEAQRRLAASRERILSSLVVENHLKQTVNPTTIRKMYDAQAALRNRGDEVRARHILVAEEDTIKTVAKKLADGEDFADLATEYSVDRASKGNGGDLGYFTEDMLSDVFTNMAFNTPLKTVSDPFQSEFGWHIVEPLERRKGRQPDFEDMRDEILNFMTYDEIQNLVSDLRGQADIALLFGQAVVEGGADKDEPDMRNENLTSETPKLETP